MNKNNGLISFKDFNTYEPYIRKPISTVYRGNKVYTAGPPSGGGITLLTALNILSHFDLAKYESNSLMTYHLFSEALNSKMFFKKDASGTVVNKLGTGHPKFGISTNLDMKKLQSFIEEIAPDAMKDLGEQLGGPATFLLGQ